MIRLNELDTLSRISERIYRVQAIEKKRSEKLAQVKTLAFLRSYEAKTRKSLTSTFKSQIREHITRVHYEPGPGKSNEILEKLELLTPNSISKCVDHSFEIFEAFNIPFSVHRIISEATKLMQRTVNSVSADV